MRNVITLPNQDPKPPPGCPVRGDRRPRHGRPDHIVLARRADAPEGLIHIALMGSALGLETVATLADDDKGRSVAEFLGPAVLRAVELAETEFAARPEAC